MERGRPRFTQEFAVSRVTQEHLRFDLGLKYTAVTFFGHLFHGVLLPLSNHIRVLQPPAKGGVWAISVSLVAYSGDLGDFFSSGYLDISVPQLTHPRVSAGSPTSLSEGFPHSDTAGSQLRGSSPTTIVVMYVLLRHPLPRHPLSAL